MSIHLLAQGIRQSGAGIPWADQMLESYRTLNPEQATYFDGAGAAVQTEFLARLQPGGYLQNTFGPTGQNKTVCDFVFVLKTVGNIVSRTITKTGDALRWDIDGTVTTQNDLPNHTLAGAGILTCSTTDGWTGLTQFRIDNNQFSGTAPNWNLPNVTEFRIDNNQFSGTAPNWNLPNVAIFKIYTNQFSGDAPAWSIPSVTLFWSHDNKFSGDAPAWNLPNVTEFFIHNNKFSGDAPAWNLPNVTIFLISNNQFSSVDAPLASITKVTDLRTQGNGLLQAAVDAAFSAIHGARASYTGTSPALQIHGTNAAPSGTFQANCPTPASGKEEWYHLVNDPCTEGFVKWTVTANT